MLLYVVVVVVVVVSVGTVLNGADVGGLFELRWSEELKRNETKLRVVAR